MEYNVQPPPSTTPSMPPFGLKRLPHNLPNPTILTVIFGVLLVSVIGMGTVVVMSGNTTPPPQAAPTPTPTPDPTRGWQDYSSSFYGLRLKIPSGWKIQEGGGRGDNSLYFHSNEVVGNTRYYVYVTILPNPQGLSLQDALQSYYSIDVPFSEEQLGANTLFMSTRVPSRQGALSAFFPMVGSSDYLTLSLTPYDSNQPLREQDRYEKIFRQTLTTVTLSKPDQPSIASSSASLSEDSTSPHYWKTYVDRLYPLSFDYPPDYILDTSRQGRILLNENLEVIVTPVNPDKCTGVCPVREKTSSVTINDYTAKKYEGYLTSEGGQIPQRYLQYVIHERDQYYMFTLYEVGKNANVAQDRTPQPIPLEDIQVFEKILNTIRFSR